MLRRTNDAVNRWLREGRGETPPPKSQFDHEAAEHARRLKRAADDYEFAVEREKAPHAWHDR